MSYYRIGLSSIILSLDRPIYWKSCCCITARAEFYSI